MIGHHLKFAQLYILKMLRRLGPTTLNELTELVWMHFLVLDIPKFMFHISGVRRDEIGADRTIVPVLPPTGLDSVFVIKFSHTLVVNANCPCKLNENNSFSKY